MDTTITLDEPHYQLARDKAKTLGTTPDRYLAALIDADARSFDQILEPVRKVMPSTEAVSPRPCARYSNILQ